MNALLIGPHQLPRHVALNAQSNRKPKASQPGSERGVLSPVRTDNAPKNFVEHLADVFALVRGRIGTVKALEYFGPREVMPRLRCASFKAGVPEDCELAELAGANVRALVFCLHKSVLGNVRKSVLE